MTEAIEVVYPQTLHQTCIVHLIRADIIRFSEGQSGSVQGKQTRQAENQDKIIAVANEMVSRVQILCERLNKAEACLKKTQEAFEDVRTMAQPAGRSITSSANKLLKFGAKKDSRHAALPSTEE